MKNDKTNELMKFVDDYKEYTKEVNAYDIDDGLPDYDLSVVAYSAIHMGLTLLECNSYKEQRKTIQDFYTAYLKYILPYTHNDVKKRETKPINDKECYKKDPMERYKLKIGSLPSEAYQKDNPYTSLIYLVNNASNGDKLAGYILKGKYIDYLKTETDASEEEIKLAEELDGIEMAKLITKQFN